MMFIKKGKGNVLEKEPYLRFLKKFDRLDNITNEKIHMRITSGSSNKKSGFNEGFSINYVYTKWFDFEFQFASLFDEECKNQEFCIFHTLSYKFEDENYQDMMMETIGDIQKRNGYLYISSLVQSCEINCSVNNKNVVTISFCVFCEKKDAREVCLQLISQDMALFTRSF